MEKKTFRFSAFAAIIIIIGILFSACGIGSDDPSQDTTETGHITNENTIDYDESSSAPIISENTSNSKNEEKVEEVYEYYQCFVAGEGEYYIENNLTPGYLYFHEDWDSEIKLLLAKKLKTMNGAEFKNSIYVITGENEIIEVSKTDGSYKAIYTAKYGTIDYISSINCFNRYVYFNDGEHIVELDPINNECKEILKTDKKICVIKPGGDVLNTYDNGVYCDICGPDGEYFIYTVGSEEEGYESYWHHPETGTNEQIDINYIFTYGKGFNEGYTHLSWKVEK